MKKISKKLKKCLHCKHSFTTVDGRQLYCTKTCKDAESQHRYYLNNKEKYNRDREIWRLKNPLRTKYLYARADIKRRGRGGLHVSYEDCLRLWDNGCFYCQKDVKTEKGVSLDRINNDKGYTLDNVLPCCGDCNIMRSDILTVNEMEIAMTAILDYRRELNG